MKIQIFLAALCSLLLLLAGCGDDSGGAKPTAEGSKISAQPGDTTPDSAAVDQQFSGGEGIRSTNTSGPASNATDNPSAGSPVYADSAAAAVLRRMGKAYTTASSYRDQGEGTVRFRLQGELQEESFPVQAVYVAPNKINLKSYEGEIVSDGKKIYSLHPEVRGYVAVSEAPEKLTPEKVYGDPFMRYMLTQRVLGAALQVSMLLSDSVVERGLLAPSIKEPALLKPAEIDGHLCDCVELQRPEGTMTLWVDQKTSVLRRVEYPTEEFSKQLSQQGDVAEVAMQVNFKNAELNAKDISEEAFQLDTRELKEVRQFVGAALPEMLGKTPGDYEFVTPEGEKITPEQLKDKVVVIDFWATWCQPCLLAMPKLQQVYEKYKDNDRVRILAINVEDPAEIKLEAINQVLQRLEVTLPLARDPKQQAFSMFDVTGLPTTVFLGPDGRVQDLVAGLNPQGDFMAEMSDRIDKLLEGQQIHQQRLADFEAQMMQSPQGDVEDEGAISNKSELQHVKLTELWTNQEVMQPGNILLVPGEEGADRMFVMEGVTNLVELDAEGQIVKRHELDLPQDSLVTFFRTAVDGQGKRYYVGTAPGGQLAHVFDADWKRVLSYPEGVEHRGIYDVTLADLDGDGQLELYVGYLDAVGVQQVTLEGDRQWTNRSFEFIFSLATTDAAENGQRHLLCTHSKGVVSILDSKGERLRDVAVPDHPIPFLEAADLDGDGKKDYCGFGQRVAAGEAFVGFKLDGSELWRLDVPVGPNNPALRRVTTGQLIGPEKHWILAGLDASLHFVSTAGEQLDAFNYGSEITGLGAIQLDGKPVLLLSTPEKVIAYEVTAKE